MGYKEDIEMQKNYEEYGESLVSDEGDNKKYIKKLQYIFGRETINELPLPELNKMLQIIAKKEYADIIISYKAKLARDYDDVVVPKIYLPKISTLSDQNQELDELERKTKFINTMNSIIELVNLVHDKSNPVVSNIEKNVVIEQSIAEKSPKRLREKEGIVYSLDDENYLSLTEYKESKQIGLRCGDVDITVSPDLIDMQFGEKEGIIFSKDFKYYKLVDSKKALLDSSEYEVSPQSYSQDLTDELLDSHDDIIEIISTSINCIENEKLREKVLQDFNYLLARARLKTITHIPDERDKKLEIIKGKVVRYHDRMVGENNELKRENEKLKEENEELKNKSSESRIDEIIKENEKLKKQNEELATENAELREKVQTEKSSRSKNSIFGKFFAKKIDEENKNSESSGSVESTSQEFLKDLRYDGVDYSKANKISKPEKKQEPRTK